MARRARTQVGAAGLARAFGNLAPRLALWRALGWFNHQSGCSGASKQLWLSYIPFPSAHSQSSEATLEDTNPLPGLPGTILDTDGEQDFNSSAIFQMFQERERSKLGAIPITPGKAEIDESPVIYPVLIGSVCHRPAGPVLLQTIICLPPSPAANSGETPPAPMLAAQRLRQTMENVRPLITLARNIQDRLI